MATTYVRKKRRYNNIIYTAVTALLIVAVFLSLLNFFYSEARNDAYEMLHLQTKQIKDDLVLQMKSDRENLVTMAHFAADLYADGVSYDRMFDAFEPIGLLSAIGILNPDNTFVTKMGKIDLKGKIDFEREAQLGAYISGRVEDLTRDGAELIRSAVPITVEGETVGILYGVITLETIGEKYNNMAKELDAQLFVYDKKTGDYVINTVENAQKNISSLKDRKYNDGYSFDDILNKPNGYSSFKSVRNGEDLYLHFSTIDEPDWGIMLARFNSQVFAKTHKIVSFMISLFVLMVLIISVYFLAILQKERKNRIITQKASQVRKMLLEINQKHDNVIKALEIIMDTSRSELAMFVDTEGEDLNCIDLKRKKNNLSDEDRKFFVSELFRYAIEIKNAGLSSMSVMSIKPDSHLRKTNPAFFSFFKKRGLKRVVFAAIAHNDRNSNVEILGVVNPGQKYSARSIIEEIAVCFSIALNNKKHLNNTYAAATTDSLTNVANRVAYNRDLQKLNDEKPALFTCIYVDVNELHLRNNRYGHAAGDEMLVYIANSLKNIFYGQKIYRMGGDEFLVFVRNVEFETIKRCIDLLNEQLRSKDYHVAVGISFREKNTDTEDVVREAERRMYDAKAEYYQNKEKATTTSSEDNNYVMAKTGIREVDTMLSVLKDHYNGIYRVSLKTDQAHRILMPSYLGYNENEKCFSAILSKYIEETVHPDFHRAVLSFLNFDALRKQIAEGKTPRITYKRVNGELVILSVYKLDDDKDNINETLWVFSKA